MLCILSPTGCQYTQYIRDRRNIHLYTYNTNAICPSCKHFADPHLLQCYSNYTRYKYPLHQHLISHLSILLNNKHTLCPSSRSVTWIQRNTTQHSVHIYPKINGFHFPFAKCTYEYLPSHRELRSPNPPTQISKHTSQDIQSVTKRHLPSINARK